MKKIVFILGSGLLFLLNSCGNKNVSSQKDAVKTEETATVVDKKGEVVEENTMNPEEAPVITFEEKLYDFGTIQTGDIVEHLFKFSNTGKAPLIITNAKATCGCTVPEWPKEPILPGESGEIKVKFNSRGKSGVNNKVITLTTNTVNVKETVNIKVNINNPNKKANAAKAKKPVTKHGFGESAK